jgi:hypothetical protein
LTTPPNWAPRVITDAYMREMLRSTKDYTVVILHRTAKRDEPGANEIVWEHGRRNFELKRDGQLCIVCPAFRDESDNAGLCIFSTGIEETRRIMEGDPAVSKGILTYEIHRVTGFPGDSLAL